MREKKKLKSCRLEKCVLLILDTEHKVDVLINSVWSKMKARELMRKLFEEIVCKYLRPSIWNVHIGNFLYVVQLYVYKMLKKISILSSEHERTVAELCVNTSASICSVAHQTSKCLSWVEFVFLELDPSWI